MARHEPHYRSLRPEQLREECQGESGRRQRSRTALRLCVRQTKTNRKTYLVPKSSCPYVCKDSNHASWNLPVFLISHHCDSLIGRTQPPPHPHPSLWFVTFWLRVWRNLPFPKPMKSDYDFGWPYQIWKVTRTVGDLMDMCSFVFPASDYSIHCTDFLFLKVIHRNIVCVAASKLLFTSPLLVFNKEGVVTSVPSLWPTPS